MSDAPIKDQRIKEEDFDKFYVSTIIAEYDNPINLDFAVLFISYDFFMGEAYFVVRTSKDTIKQEKYFKYLFEAIQFYNSFISKGE